MRAFLATDLEPGLEAPCRAAAAGLGPASGFRFPPPEHAHLTLLFLGEVLPESAGPLGEAAAKALAPLPPFEVRTAGLGAFPDAKRARILWLGIEDPSGGFQRMHAALSRAFPFAEEARAFRPHLTLARHRGAGSDVAALLAKAPPPSPSMHLVTGASLWRSVLSPSGPVHERLSAAPLGGR